MSIVNRLITAQGPSQLINVISILKEREHSVSDISYKDYLIVGGLDTVKCSYTTSVLGRVMSQISSLWNFEACYYIDDQFIPIPELNTFSCSLNDLQAQVYAELFLCRNWQPFNLYMLKNIDFSQVTFYGDGYGFLDLEPLQLLPDKSITKASLFIPLDFNNVSFGKCSSIYNPDIGFLLSTFNDISNSFPDAAPFIQAKSEELSPPLIITTELYSEGNFIKFLPFRKSMKLLVQKLFHISQNEWSVIYKFLVANLSINPISFCRLLFALSKSSNLNFLRTAPPDFSILTVATLTTLVVPPVVYVTFFEPLL